MEKEVSFPYKCQLLRDGIFHELSNECPYNVSCLAGKMAELNSILIWKKQKLFKNEADIDAIKNIEGDIAMINKTMQKNLGINYNINVDWNNYADCLWNPNEAPGLLSGNKYFSRKDLVEIFGYRSFSMIGGNTLMDNDEMLNYVKWIPLHTDKYINPFFLAIFIIILVVSIFILLIINKRNVLDIPTKSDADHLYQ